MQLAISKTTEIFLHYPPHHSSEGWNGEGGIFFPKKAQKPYNPLNKAVCEANGQANSFNFLHIRKNNGGAIM
jgi:hypothetical protein